MKKPNKDIIPIAISLALILISLWMSLIQNYVLEKAHYMGMMAIVVCIFFYFVNKKLYLFTFAFTLVTGLVGFIDFYYVSFKIGFGIIEVNPIFIALFALFFGLGKDSINNLFPEKNKSPKQ